MNIRIPNLDKVNEKGIPLDFIGSMKLFNELLNAQKIPYCPRKIKITIDEIKNLWIPSAEENITFVAEKEGRIVASGTLLVDEKSNEYSQKSGRDSQYALIFGPEYKDEAKEITRRVIEEAKKRNVRFKTHISVEDGVENSIMRELGLKPIETVEHYQRYADAGMNPKAYKYVIERNRIILS